MRRSWAETLYLSHFETDVPVMTTAAGSYTVNVGFWPGGEGRRLKNRSPRCDGWISRRLLPGSSTGQGAVHIGQGVREYRSICRAPALGEDL